MVIEFRPPVSESSNKATKLNAPTASENKFCENGNQKLAANGNSTGVLLHGNQQTQPLGYIQLSLSGALIFNTPINKVLK